MSKRSVLAGAFGAAALFVVAQGGAAANMVWCYTDPPVQVTTPGGHHLTVNNTVYLPPNAIRYGRYVTDTATAVPDGHGGTLIVVTVHIPESVDSAWVVSSEYRYSVSDSDTSEGGGSTTTFLDVPTS